MAAVKKEKTKEVTAIGARSMAVKKMLTSILDCIGIDEAKKNYIGTMRQAQPCSSGSYATPLMVYALCL